MIKRSILPAVLSGFVFFSNAALHSAEAPDPVSVLGSELSDPSGLILHIGCGEGALTAKLAEKKSYLVQGLDSDPAAVAAARRLFEKNGNYGRVTAVVNDLKSLPYPDNVANMIVAETPVSKEELMRVLAPGGILIVRSGKTWTKTVKPWPAGFDNWPQYRHDAARSGITADTAVAAPSAFHWLQESQWTGANRTELSLADGGRVFFVLHPSSVERNRTILLEARDAFNGAFLWSRPIIGSGQGPKEQMIAAGADRVFAPGEDGHLAVIDAATGKTISNLDLSGPLAVSGNRLIVHDSANTWAVIDPVKGKTVAKLAVRAAPEGNPMLAADGRAYLIESDPAAKTSDIVCVDLADGKALWRAPNIGNGRFVASQRGLLFLHAPPGTPAKAGGRGADPVDLHAYSASDGRHLWQYRSKLKIGSKPAVFYLGDRVWTYDDLPLDKEKHYLTDPAAADSFNLGYVALDPQTGKKLGQDTGLIKEGGRCGPDYANERFILGMDMAIYDLTTGAKTPCVFVRGDCDLSELPAYGMFYSHGHECVCRAYVGGVVAVGTEPPPARATEGFVRGPAFSKNPAAESAASPGEWPTWRGNNFRSGVAPGPLPASLNPAWRAKVGVQTSAPVVAGGLVLASSIEDHRIHAFDAETGKPKWTYTAQGRVDSAPTFDHGFVLFGANDGWVTCLRASDGAEVWRRRIAPAERFIPVRGQMESSWPVPGSVLVENGVAFAVAGRHASADGGLWVSAMAPATGELLWEGQARDLDSYNDVPAFNGGLLFAGSVGIDLKTHAASDRPRGAALYGGGGGLLFDNSAPSQAWANRQQWMVAGPQWTPDGIRSTRKQSGAVWANQIVMTGDRIYAVRQDYNRDKTDCTTTVFAVNNRALPADNAAYDLTKAPERLWAHQFKGSHDRIKATVLAGDKLWLANQPGGTELGKLDVNAGELIALDAATGEECSRLPFETTPLFDGMAVAGGKLFIATQTGEIIAFR